MAAPAVYKPKAVKDVSAEDFIKAYAAHLKSNDKIQLPTWVDVIKTATFKEMCPQDADWYYIRAASLVRRIYIRPGMGVGLFRTVYGGRVRRGAAPEHFAKASGGLVRHIFHQLESVGLVEKVSTGGRRVTANGQRDMDLIAGRITTQLQQF